MRAQGLVRTAFYAALFASCWLPALPASEIAVSYDPAVATGPIRSRQILRGPDSARLRIETEDRR